MTSKIVIPMILTILTVCVVFQSKTLYLKRRLSSDKSTNRNLQNMILTGVKSTSSTAPSLLWLMNFPDSGGSSIIDTIQKASGFNTASNHGKHLVNRMGEYIVENRASVPIYSDRPSGPFLYSYDYPMPRSPEQPYIVTNTYCGDHCIDCIVEEYLLKPDDFWMSCAKTIEYTGAEGGVTAAESKYGYAQYDHMLVKKIIHLVRNPFDNIINRFHREYNFHATNNDFEFTKDFPMSKRGFYNWCSYLAEKYQDRDQRFFVQNYGFEAWTLASQVPCYSEFFKYIQFHNHAGYTKRSMNVPSFEVHFENLLHRMEPSIQSMLTFAGLEFKEIPKRFFYQKFDYFISRDLQNAKLLMKILATEDTHKLLKMYLK